MTFFVYKHIKILHQNINGLLAKSDIMTVCLDDLKEAGKDIDVLCFTEHNMTNQDTELLNIPNFTLATYFSRDKREGGSCILVRRNLKFSNITSVKRYFVPNVIECCAIELIDHDLIILCIYRVPKKKEKKYYFDIFFNNLNDILNLLISKSTKKVAVCGDFNIDLLTRNK